MTPLSHEGGLWLTNIPACTTLSTKKPSSCRRHRASAHRFLRFAFSELTLQAIYPISSTHTNQSRGGGDHTLATISACTGILHTGPLQPPRKIRTVASMPITPTRYSGTPLWLHPTSQTPSRQQVSPIPHQCCLTPSQAANLCTLP